MDVEWTASHEGEYDERNPELLPEEAIRSFSVEDLYEVSLICIDHSNARTWDGMETPIVRTVYQVTTGISV